MRALVLSLLCLAAQPGQAATAWGTLITNVATITMNSGFPDFVAYSMTYNMTCAVPVGIPAPTLSFEKTVSPTSMGSGGTLTYTLWITNSGPWDSAFNVHVIDIIPGVSGVMAYTPGQDNWVDGTPGATVTLGHGSQPPWNGFLTQYWTECPAGQTGPYGIRWIVSMIGPGKSALLCWKARVL